MNAKKMVTLSNVIGVTSIILLVYWVFIFILVHVFDLKVFGQNITSLFYFSIMGILSLMFGALMINIMSNLTRIAERHNDDSSIATSKKHDRIFWIPAILSFPVIALFLLFGDHLTTLRYKEFMLHDASEITTTYQNELNRLTDYKFSKKWITNVQVFLKLLEKRGSNYSPSLIVTDKINNTTIYLDFDKYHYSLSGNDDAQKSDFYFHSSPEEKKYLNDVFENHHKEPLFSVYRGVYRFFFPYRYNDKIVVLLMTGSSEYGKLGS